MANKFMLLNLLVYLIIYPVTIYAQTSRLSSEKQQLWLQLSLNFYTVVKEGQVDQDSSLVLVSRKGRLSRWTVITDGFSDDIAKEDNKWIDTRQTRQAVKILGTLHGIDHVKLLVLLGSYYAFQPGYSQNDRDSAQYFLSKAKQESEALHSAFWSNQSLCLLGKNYFKGNQVEKGTKCFTDLINICQRANDKVTEAKAWDYQGTYCPPLPATIMLKINSLAKANILYQQLNKPAKQVNTLTNLAYLAFVLKDIKGAEVNALKALQLENAMAFPYTHYNYDLLSLICKVNGNDDRGTNYGLKAVRASQETKDSIGLGYFYARVADLHYGSKTISAFASYWFKKAVEELSKNGDPAIYRALFNYTSYLNESGKSREAILLLSNTLKTIPPASLVDKQMAYLSIAANYKDINNYRQAEKYFLMADHLSDQDKLITKDFRSAQIKLKIGTFYFEIKQYDKAKSYLQNSLAIPVIKMNEPITFSAANWMLFKIDSLQGNYESAAKHLLQYVTYYKKIVELNDAKNIAGMKIQLEMTQKEKDLQILRAKNALQNQQADNVRKLIYIGVALTVLIIGMIYYRFYINRKNNEKLQAQKDEIDHKNHLLESLLHDKDVLLLSKEWLLKEVHHRVKNNLHTVICLLESQAAYLENDALKAIENSQNRIYAMSLIHQKLYQSEDIKTIDMSVYIPEFVSYLNDSFGTTSQIRFELDIQPLRLAVSYAVPLSLIINEAVTNSIKYAFPGKKKGAISITMYQINEQVELIIADNGIGINAHKSGSHSGALGLKLLRGLSEDIKAEISIENVNGTTITLKFKIDEMIYATA
ncbi:hypothetical protein DIU31_009625 [Mucilaginibacter rubeus]|uniref:histidine kinase n=1 Tax=Mucilaginibacter rubeus TaxID=2027860 RepID=A0AAE6JDK3_9SPHI|nr:hypothetical protein DIU31_009625 [Mucilaginibacter rubeus]QEM16370.1 hypothetical protein DIU38_009720 [Mucilaginibacter gossypii]